MFTYCAALVHFVIIALYKCPIVIIINMI